MAKKKQIAHYASTDMYGVFESNQNLGKEVYS